ncbi:ComEC family competence protein [Rasiella rasia]|uniref:ComEC family competence protein n=1 Tax=Rasiella rasia TaxID=2744027 RepID=A0A6G6GLD7_9FLAO|nr:ComEC/Rec2 family competence protein [Rasiella rasia]QIE59395.1 ComEC family competence protein [Rasiella rasia]
MALFLALGITFGFYTNKHPFVIPKVWWFGILILPIVLLGITWLLGKRKLHPTPVFGLIVCFIFFGIGFANYTLRLPKYQPSHYTNNLQKDTFLQLKIKEHLKPNSYYENYLAEVIFQNATKTTGLLLLHIEKDSTVASLAVDEYLVVKGNPQRVRQPRNPYQFNYAQYMEHLGVHREMTIKSNSMLFRRKVHTSIVGFSERIRLHLIAKLQQTTLKHDELSILQAFVLGERRAIDKQLYEAYAAAGAIHILAVSGLHVGILYFILLFLLKPLTYTPYGARSRSIIIVLLLWCFALLAGLSPSVVRAVTMFSFFTVATALNRPTNSFNTLLLSFLVLLLIAPSWLFHVGFQLSYLAVFFILWLQPKLYALYKPKFYIDKTLWGIITVTIAAQAGILPLSLYYFHQFPGLFFLTNIVVLPVLGILLAGGLLLIVLAACNAVPTGYTEIYNEAITILNDFITWVAQQDFFLVRNISFSAGKMMVSYLVLVCLVILWKKTTSRRLVITLGSIALFVSVCIWDKKETSLNELVVFHKNRKTLIGVKTQEQLLLFSNDTTQIDATQPIPGYRAKMAIDSTTIAKVPSLFEYGDTTFLILDSLGVYSKLQQVDIAILTHSSKVNLTRFIDSVQPKLIIADGSNYKSYIDRWRETCTIKKLPFHHTGTKGAFTFK